jgi:hypothetical protein
MNKQFVQKILQAKQLEYEALKEIMPEKIVNQLDALEDELLEYAREYFRAVVRNKANQEGETSPKTMQGIRKVTIQ